MNVFPIHALHVTNEQFLKLNKCVFVIHHFLQHNSVNYTSELMPKISKDDTSVHA